MINCNFFILTSGINNKYINSFKTDIELYLQTSGISSSSIDILANIGFLITKKTVNHQKTLTSESYQDTVNSYLLQNIENMFILNIDDYHNIHLNFWTNTAVILRHVF